MRNATDKKRHGLQQKKAKRESRLALRVGCLTVSDNDIRFTD